MDAFATCTSHLRPNSLTKIGFVEFVVFISSATVLVSVSVSLRAKDFTCSLSGDQFKNKDFIHNRCYKKYEREYERFPQWAFVLVYVAFILLVRLVYTVYVKKRAAYLRRHENASVSEKRRAMEYQQSRSQFPIYSAYRLQIIIRIVIMLLFVLVQWFLCYPKSFPEQYHCVLEERSASVNNTRATSTSAGNGTVSSSDLPLICQNSHSRGKNLWNMFVTVCIVMLIVASVIDLTRVCCFSHKNFAKDYEFCRHLLAGTWDETDTCDVELGDIPVSAAVTVHSFMENMRMLVCRHTETINVFLSDDEPIITLDDVFTNMRIQHGRVKYDFRGKQRENIIGMYPKHTNATIDKPEALFVSNAEIGDTRDPRTILIQGRGGIGKTVLSMKLVRDWASSKFSLEPNKKFQFAFLSYFRSLDFSDGNLTLRKFLECSPVCPEPLDDLTFEYIENNPETVLIVIDGFDEYKNEFVEQNICSHLLSGKVLSGATIVITSRPEAVEKLRNVNFDRKVEILGFSPEEVKVYFTKFLQNQPENMIANVYNKIEKNQNLLHLCYVPINCFLVCSYLTDTVINPQELPRSLAGLYELVLAHFLRKHHPECKDKTEAECQKVILADVQDKLSYPALYFLQQRCFHFKESDILNILTSESTAANEKVIGLKKSCLFHRMSYCKTNTLTYETFYCFIHLTVQEFLAAQSLVKRNELPAVSREWFVVIQFMAGLLAKEENGREMMRSIVNKIICEGMRAEMRNTLIVRCLHEYGNRSFAQEVVTEQNLTEFGFDGQSGFSAADFSALNFLITNSPVRKIKLSNTITRVHECAELAEALAESFVCSLSIINCGIGDDCAAHFKEALCSANCQLQNLDLSSNSIGDDGAVHFKEALCSANCQLQNLDLSSNGIGDDGAACFKEALCSANCHLQVLYLICNNIGADGAAHFKEALSSADCHLQKLGLSHNNIGADGAAHFKEALSNANCHLEKLSLTHNNIGADGAAHFKEALCSANCQLQKLDLSQNNIGADGAAHFKEALCSANCKLQKLYLGCNYFNAYVDSVSSHCWVENAGSSPNSGELPSLMLMELHISRKPCVVLTVIFRS